MSLHK